MFGLTLFDECVNLINHWVPKQKYPNELKYRDDLMDFLYGKLNKSGDVLSESRNVKLKKEASRSLCDIGVGDQQVGIELKKDLKSKSQINRLQGQIEDYEDDYKEGVIVVLVGKVDKYVENDLRHKLIKKLNKSISFGLQQFRIKLINKSDSKIQSSSQKFSNSFDFDLGIGNLD